jgi:type I restriction enzyme M protein
MKTQDVPPALRGFNDIFRKLEYRHAYVTVFDDFLTAMMNYFTPPEYQPLDVTCFGKYSEDERKLFYDMIVEVIHVLQRELSNARLWYDVFGDYYQLLASRGKQSALGQFFTPDPAVDMMIQLQGDKDELTGKGLTIADPACGSGRMLIAYHAHFPGNYTFGEDLDPMCCKMTCLNMMLHGCEGEVVNHNALMPDSYIRGWRINPTIRRIHLPTITPLPKEESFVVRMWEKKKAEAAQQQAEADCQKAEADRAWHEQVKRDREQQGRQAGTQLDMF